MTLCISDQQGKRRINITSFPTCASAWSRHVFYCKSIAGFGLGLGARSFARHMTGSRCAHDAGHVLSGAGRLLCPFPLEQINIIISTHVA